MRLSEREYAALMAPVTSEDVVIAIAVGVAVVFLATLICMIRDRLQRGVHALLLPDQGGG